METKVCLTCKDEKLLEEFNTNGWNGGKRDGKRKYHAHCKSCMSDQVTETFLSRLRKAIGGGELKCQECGYDKHHSAIDFHHLDPTQKDMMICSLRGCSFKKIKSEVDKCIMLCANCHRLVHNGVMVVEVANDQIV